MPWSGWQNSSLQQTHDEWMNVFKRSWQWNNYSIDRDIHRLPVNKDARWWWNISNSWLNIFGFWSLRRKPTMTLRSEAVKAHKSYSWKGWSGISRWPSVLNCFRVCGEPSTCYAPFSSLPLLGRRWWDLAILFDVGQSNKHVVAGFAHILSPSKSSFSSYSILLILFTFTHVGP